MQQQERVDLGAATSLWNQYSQTTEGAKKREFTGCCISVFETLKTVRLQDQWVHTSRV